MKVLSHHTGPKTQVERTVSRLCGRRQRGFPWSCSLLGVVTGLESDVRNVSVTVQNILQYLAADII